MKGARIQNYSGASQITSVQVRPISPSVTRIHLSAAIPGIIRRNPRLDDTLAEMLKRGSKGYSKEALEAAFDSLGSEWSVRAEAGMFHVSITSRNEALLKTLELLDVLLRKPLFKSGELDKLKKEGFQIIHELQDDARYRAGTLFSRMLYDEGDHRHAPDLLSEKQALVKVNQSELRLAHKILLSSNWFVSVSGPEFAYRAMLKMCEKFPKPKVALAGFTPLPRAHKQGKAQCDFVAGKQNVELFIGHTIPLIPGTADFAAFSFGIDILGKRGGFAGRLMSTVREKEGLTYGIYAWLAGAHATYPGHFVIGTFFTPKDIEKGIDATLREVRKICAEGVSESEVTKFKRLLLNQYTLAFESGETTIAAYHNALTLGFPPSYVDEYEGRIGKVTAKDVTRVLKEYLRPDNLCFAGAGALRKLPLTATATRRKVLVSK